MNLRKNNDHFRSPFFSPAICEARAPDDQMDPPGDPHEQGQQHRLCRVDLGRQSPQQVSPDNPFVQSVYIFLGRVNAS